jgi:hypothetical protein
VKGLALRVRAIFGYDALRDCQRIIAFDDGAPIMKAEYYTTIFQLIPDSLPESFYIVTAWNPFGKTVSVEENHARDAQLESDVQSRKPFRVIGMSPDEKHGEPGWGFVATEEEALALAIKYEQDAIYHIGDNQLTLISADGSERAQLGLWPERVHDPRKRILFSLYLGSRSPATTLSQEERDGIFARIAEVLPSFTVLEASGHFLNEREQTLVIQLATDKPKLVLNLAHELLSYMAQEGVGVLYNGIYQRVRAWTDDRLILQSWGLNLD